METSNSCPSRSTTDLVCASSNRDRTGWVWLAAGLTGAVLIAGVAEHRRMAITVVGRALVPDSGRPP